METVTLTLTKAELEAIIYFVEKPYHEKAQRGMVSVLENHNLYDLAIDTLES